MKKIAAIHDLSGYGRASLTVAIPILTHMGFQVCPLPTAILSAHSEYKNFRSLDLTDYMESFIAHWKELQLNFDAIYTGYLASVKQMDIVLQKRSQLHPCRPGTGGSRGTVFQHDTRNGRGHAETLFTSQGHHA